MCEGDPEGGQLDLHAGVTAPTRAVVDGAIVADAITAAGGIETAYLFSRAGAVESLTV